MNSIFGVDERIKSSIADRLLALKKELGYEYSQEYMGCSGCVEGQKRCGIILTKKCQLRCTYCYEKGKNAASMSFEMAKSIVDKELEKDDAVKSVHIDLFGGEPFLAFDVMKELVEYLKSDNFSKDFYITTITNGVAIHGEIQDWLIENRGVIECPLSLDGTRQMQEISRPGSFDRIDIDFFTREFPGTRAKMTVSPYTLPSLAEGTIFLHDHKFSPKNGLAYGIEWPDDSADILVRELEKLIKYYLENPDLEESLMLKMPYRDLVKRQRSCDAGKSMVMYDVDGTRWPCHMFLPMSIGEEKSSRVKDLDFSQTGKADVYCDSECEVCPIRKSCVVCRGMNYNEMGSLMGRNEDICRLTKIIYRAKAYLASEKWKRGCYKNLNADDERMLLDSINLCLQL